MCGVKKKIVYIYLQKKIKYISDKILFEMENFMAPVNKDAIHYL